MTVKRILNVENLLFVFALSAMLALIVGGGYQGAVLQGINLWVITIIPSMFPYFFLSSLLSQLSLTGSLSYKLSPITKKVFRANGCTGYALIMSIISGYPMGAKIVADLKKGGAISDAEGVRASIFCSTSSPIFMIGTVGATLFNSVKFGVLLSVTHLLSTLICGFIFSFYKKDQPIKQTLPSTTEKNNAIFYDSVLSSVNSTLFVGGIITLFYVFIEILLSLGLLNAPIKLLGGVFASEDISTGLIFGLIESTRGFKALSNGGITLFTLPVAGVLSGFGGLSVIAQSVAFLQNAKIKTAWFYLGKIMQAVISFIVGLIFSLIFF